MGYRGCRVQGAALGLIGFSVYIVLRGFVGVELSLGLRLQALGVQGLGP